MRATLVACFLTCLSSADMAAAESAPRYTILPWAELSDWADDDHKAALAVFRETCTDLQDREWAKLCALAQDQTNARAFFELFFRPVHIDDGAPGLFTGYYEPELAGSRTRSPRFRYPLYRKPPEVEPVQTWYTRAEIEESGLLAGRGL